MSCTCDSLHDSRVIESKPVFRSKVIRRRRQCLACARRFTTYEMRGADVWSLLHLMRQQTPPALKRFLAGLKR